MAKIQEMLALNGGDFAKAEQMALDRVAAGLHETWLDLALLMHAQGKIEGVRQCFAMYAKKFPTCPRLKFGATWMALYDGDIDNGLKHIDAGRVLGTLGDNDFSKFKTPMWNGETDLKGKTVMLYAEGGQGDQIMGVRAAVWFKEIGARVIVLCSRSLMHLLARVPGVDAVLAMMDGHRNRQDGAMTTLCHYDYWVPTMDSFRLTKRKWKTLWPGKYMSAGGPMEEAWKAIVPKVPKTLNIGIRWRGNPEFEHEQFRWFPPELLFKVTTIPGCKFYSLQKDERQTPLPTNVVDLEPFLSTWEQTAEAIQRMDVVISSCTSIAHLAAAMEKDMRVIVPVMPYYPWARPGSKSQWYPSAMIYRQRKFGNWDVPFDELFIDIKALAEAQA